MIASKPHHTRWIVGLAVLFFAAGWGVSFAGPAEDQYNVAAGHYARGRYDEAAREFRAYIERFGFDHPEQANSATFFLGESLIQLGQYDEAREQFRRFLLRAPQHAYARQALFRQGETAYLKGDSAAAEKDLAEFRAKYPDDPLQAYVLAYLAELSLKAGNAATAKALYIDAIKRFPESPLVDDCRLGLARSLAATGDTANAVRFFEYLAAKRDSPLAEEAYLQLGLTYYRSRQYEQALKTLAAFEQAFPQSEMRVAARYWQGLVHLAAGRYDEADRTLAAASDDPRHPLAAEIAFQRGEALLKAGRNEEARRHYERVLANWPDHRLAPDALRGKIESAAADHDFALVDASVAQFDRRYGESPVRPEVRRLYGRTLLRRERFDEAATVFAELAARPGGASNAYFLAVAHLGRQRYEEALQALEKVEAAPQEGGLAEAVLMARSSALMALENYAAAAEILRALLDLSPDGPDANESRAQLAIALAATDRRAEAKAVLAELERRDPRHPRFLPAVTYVAETAYAAEDRELARDLFAILARDGNPEEYVAKGLSGLTWCELGQQQPDEAAESFQRLLEEHPDSPLVPEAALARARKLEDARQYDGALAVYRLVIDKYVDSPQYPYALLGAAVLHDRMQQHRQAAELLERLVTEHPRLPQLDAVLYRWAWVLADLDRAEEADAVFSRIYMEHRQSGFWADAAYRLAERAARQQRYDRAAQLAEEIIAASPPGDVLPHALYLRGQAAVRSGRWEEASGPLARLATEFSDSPLALAAEYWVAESAYRQGKFDESAELFARLAVKIRSRRDDWMAMVPLRQAQILGQQERWDEALEIAATIAETFPDFVKQYEVDYLLGRCLSGKGRMSEARQAYQRVIHSPAGGKTETAAMAQWAIGETYFHQKEYEEAIRAYSRVEILYDYPRWQAAALLQTGRCFEALGRWKEAADRYSQVARDFPETPFAQQAVQRLAVVQRQGAAAGGGTN